MCSLRGTDGIFIIQVNLLLQTVSPNSPQPEQSTVTVIT